MRTLTLEEHTLEHDFLLMQIRSIARNKMKTAGVVFALLVIFATATVALPDSFVLPRLALSEALQLLVGGILNAGIYAAAGIGLALIFGVMKIMNLAHGHLMILGSYFSYWAFVILGVDPFLSIAITVPSLFAIGLAFERITIEPVALGPDIQLSVIVTFASFLILENLMSVLWTADVRGISTSYSSASVVIGSTSVPIVRLLVFLVSLAAVVTLDLFLTKNRTGKALRATAQDRVMAESLGVDTKRTYRLAFGIGTAYAGLAGSLVAATFAFEPSSGLDYVFKSMAIVVLAGLGNARPILLAAIILGIVEVFGGYFLGGSIKNAFSYLIFVLVLLAKPSGLAGRERM